jgi:hypothetical protein
LNWEGLGPNVVGGAEDDRRPLPEKGEAVREAEVMGEAN